MLSKCGSVWAKADAKLGHENFQSYLVRNDNFDRMRTRSLVGKSGTAPTS
jgi:hypothetical protein